MPGMEDRTESGQFISMREFFDLRLEPVSQEIRRMRQAIEELTKETISYAEWEKLNQACQDHNKRLNALDERIDRLENYHSIGMWGFRILTGVATAVTIALAIKWLVG